jgi:FixJ family two-component response regulator
MNASKGVVYIVEDDASFRKSMERLIRGWKYEVVVFESANSFLAHTNVRYPGCLLLDVRLPDIDGLHLHQALIEKGNKLPVVFMSAHGTIPMSVQAMKRGAIDFLPKPFKPEDLYSAITNAMERNIHDLKEDFEKKEVLALIDKLTPREKEILRWVITGRLNKQIAFDLGITEKTVIVHRSRIMQKTRASSVAELVRLAEKADIPPAA